MENNEKQKVKDVNVFPELQMNDEEYVEYIHEKLRRSKDDLKHGRVITLEELKNHIDELEELYANNNL